MRQAKVKVTVDYFDINYKLHRVEEYVYCDTETLDFSGYYEKDKGSEDMIDDTNALDRIDEICEKLEDGDAIIYRTMIDNDILDELCELDLEEMLPKDINIQEILNEIDRFNKEMRK